MNTKQLASDCSICWCAWLHLIPWRLKVLSAALSMPMTRIYCTQLHANRYTVTLLAYLLLLQVFPSEGFQELYAAVKRSVAAGGPAHHLATYTVQENPYEGIAGGWQVCVHCLVLYLVTPSILHHP
jgi:hypothetical protein